MPESDTYEGMVECCGERLRADAAEVQRVMTRRGLSATAQAREWLRLEHQYAEPRWMRLCVEQARAMAALVQAEREVEAVVGSVKDAEGGESRRRPSSPLAERHFEWLGSRSGVQVAMVRGGIENLARKGYVSPDAAQQAALRRGLGIALNSEERTTQAPWVLWLGEGDALNYLIDSLWRMQLIHCSGGQRYKWQTLCGVFLRSDGTCFESGIKSNRCTNNEKRRIIDAAFLNALRV